MSPESIRETAQQINAIDWEDVTEAEMADYRGALDALLAASGYALWQTDRYLAEYLDAETYRVPDECEHEPVSSGLTIDDVEQLPWMPY